MQYLKQSTAITLKIGPFLDDADGKTAEAGLTVAQADVRLSKNGANIAQKTEATSCTHDELGIYGCPVDATDTATLGRLQLFVHESGALPVWHEYMVLPANVYDSLFSTDKLEVDLLQMGGVAQSATDLKDFADYGYDPATNKIEACKVNDDMVGTANAALASVCTEVRLAELTAANLPADVDTLLTRITAAVALASVCTEARLARLDADVSSRSSHDAADIWSTAGRALSTPADYKADVSMLALEATLTAMKGGTFNGATDSLEAIRDRGDAAWVTGAGGSDRLLMIDTTIATLASQTSFTLTAGSIDDDAYNNCTIVIEDASTATQKAVGIISNYVGASKTVTLRYDPAIFTIATTDKVYILAENALKSTLANRQLNVAADGDFAGNIDGSVASLVGHTVQTGDGYARLGAPTGATISADILMINNYVDELENRLTPTRAGNLDELGAANIPADVDTLLSRITAAVALASVCTETRLARLDAAISTRSSHTAADIWSVVTRALTDKTGFSLAASQEVQLNAQGKLDAKAEVDTALSDIYLDHLLAVDTGGVLPGAAGSIWHDLVEDDGGTWRYNANALEQAPSGGTNPNVLISTTIASVTDQTHFTLTAGSNDNDAYKNQSIVVYDASNSDYPSVRKCTGYVGSTKTVTIDTAPDFTIIAGDGTKAFVTAPGMTAPTAGENADAIWDEAIAGHTGASSFGAKNQKVVPSETLADYKATGFSIHNAADVWTAGSRELSTPNNYKADVSSIALEATLTAMKGATFVEGTDSLEAIRNQGDAAWLTAVGFSIHSAADIWSVETRALSDKVGFTLSSTGITAIWDKNISAYSGAGYAGTYIKTVYDDWLNAGRLDLILDAIAADVTGLNGNAMRGTDSAALASVCTEGRFSELDAANLPSDVDAILADTGTDGVVIASGSKTGYALSAAGVDAILDEVVEGTTTMRQMLRLFVSALAGKSAGGGTVTLTFRDLADGKNRITATVDATGNRTAMTLDGA